MNIATTLLISKFLTILFPFSPQGMRIFPMRVLYPLEMFQRRALYHPSFCTTYKKRVPFTQNKANCLGVSVMLFAPFRMLPPSHLATQSTLLLPCQLIFPSLVNFYPSFKTQFKTTCPNFLRRMYILSILLPQDL